MAGLFLLGAFWVWSRRRKPQRRTTMELWKPDPTFYPSAKLASQAPPEKHAFVALLNPTYANRPDAIGVVDVDPSSSSYGKLVGKVEMPTTVAEWHPFAWKPR